MKTNIKLTVFFDGVFWVGVFERNLEEKYEVSKFIFGSEPKDYEVYDLILHHFYSLKFKSPSIDLTETEAIDKKINPKRLQREIKKQTESVGIGTKAQLAMKLLQGENKLERKKVSKEQKEAENERKFQLRQQKKLTKHKGH